MARVGDLARQIRGVTYAKHEASAEPCPDGVPLLRAGNIGDYGIESKDQIFVPAARVRPEQYLIENDVLIATSSGSLSVVGKAARVQVSGGTFGAFCKVLRPGDGVDPGYFSHFFRTNEYRAAMSNVAAGANINNLRAADLDSLEVPLPPLGEQRRIAAILDQADAIRRAQGARLTLLEQVATVAYSECFAGDPQTVVPLSEIADVSSGITKGRKLNGAATREVPYMAVVNVQDRRLDLRNVKTIDATEQEIAKYLLRAGDLLLTEGGDPDKLGRGVVWRDELEESIHQNHIFRVRLKSELVDSTYLNWHIGSRYGRGYFLRMAKQTTGIASINSTQLKAFPVQVPSPAAQTRFRTLLSKIEKARSKAVRSRAELDALFVSLQHRAFRGEL